MRAVADLFGLVARAHLELDTSAIDLCHLGHGSYLMASRRRGEVANVDTGADGTFARIEIVAHRVERGIFHGGHHHWRGEHLRQRNVFELIGEMRRCDTQRVAPFRSHRNWTHRLGSCRAHVIDRRRQYD